MSQVSPEMPALLGGSPVRPEGPPEWPFDDPAVADALAEAVRERTWGKYHGPNCEELARRLGAYHGCAHVILCSSGTAAVELALRGLKVGPGDEVILAAYDFKGNFQDVLVLGATPVLVDIDPENWNLDPTKLAGAFSERTKAILVSHLHGGVVPMPIVVEIAQTHGIPVIEDACQMPGATICGQMAGIWGDVGVLSFGGSKLLSAGRGGALFTNNAEIAQRVRLYTQRGNEAYPLSELQAAVVRPQLEQLDARNLRRAKNAELLCHELARRPGLAPFRNSALESQPGYYKLGLKYDPAAFEGLSRDGFSQAMRAEGIALDPGFRSLHRIHSRRRFRAAGSLAEADVADENVLTLHHPVLLCDRDAIGQIVQALDKIQQSARILRDQLES